MADDKPKPILGEYQGNPTITIFINNNESYKFSFGLGKARAILDYLDDIKKFVSEHEKEKK
ncbi:MAG: hypothetical protein A2V66_06915 [Ignavibacteria bacterium RBG_13_36_8]|nr:MAG: hypothetical protein A2V66_06915 [Ignavibacteria bacterium RBG_13_36_8]